MANHHQQQPRTRKDDPILLNYNATDLRIASEFLSNWLSFLSRGLCRPCTQTLSDHIRSLELEADGLGASGQEDNFVVSTLKNMDINGCDGSHDNCDTKSLGSWNDGADMNDTADTNSLGSWKDGSPEPVAEMEAVAYTSEISRVKMSWADMAQEDELEAEEKMKSLVGRLAMGMVLLRRI